MTAARPHRIQSHDCIGHPHRLRARRQTGSRMEIRKKRESSLRRSKPRTSSARTRRSIVSSISSVQSWGLGTLEDAVSYVDSVQSDQFTAISLNSSVNSVSSKAKKRGFSSLSESREFSGNRQKQKVGSVLCIYRDEKVATAVATKYVERFLKSRGLECVHVALNFRDTNQIRHKIREIDPEEINATIFLFRDRESSRQKRLLSDPSFTEFLKKLEYSHATRVVVKLPVSDKSAKSTPSLKSFRFLPTGLPDYKDWVDFNYRTVSDITKFKANLWRKIRESCEPKVGRFDERLGLTRRAKHELSSIEVHPRPWLIEIFDKWKKMKIKRDGSVQLPDQISFLRIRSTTHTSSEARKRHSRTGSIYSKSNKKLKPRKYSDIFNKNWESNIVPQLLGGTSNTRRYRRSNPRKIVRSLVGSTTSISLDSLNTKDTDILDLFGDGQNDFFAKGLSMIPSKPMQLFSTSEIEQVKQRARIFCLMGPIGMGKSTFLKYVAMFPNDLGAYVRLDATRPSHNSAKLCISYIAAQMCENVPGFRTKFQLYHHHLQPDNPIDGSSKDLLGFASNETFLPDLTTEERLHTSIKDLFINYILGPASLLHPNTTRKVIYIDGLDNLPLSELQELGQVFSDAFTKNAPYWLRLAITSHPIGDLVSWLSGATIVSLEKWDEQNISDMKYHARYRLARIVNSTIDLELAVEKLIKLSHGWPLYLSMALDYVLKDGGQDSNDNVLKNLVQPKYCVELKEEVNKTLEKIGYFEKIIVKFRSMCLDLSLSYSEVIAIFTSCRESLPLAIFRNVLKVKLEIGKVRGLNSIMDFHNSQVEFMHPCINFFLSSLDKENPLYVDTRIGHELLSGFCLEQSTIYDIKKNVNTEEEVLFLNRLFDLSKPVTPSTVQEPNQDSIDPDFGDVNQQSSKHIKVANLGKKSVVQQMLPPIIQDVFSLDKISRMDIRKRPFIVTKNVSKRRPASKPRRNSLEIEFNSNFDQHLHLLLAEKAAPVKKKNDTREPSKKMKRNSMSFQAKIPQLPNLDSPVPGEIDIDRNEIAVMKSRQKTLDRPRKDTSQQQSVMTEVVETPVLDVFFLENIERGPKDEFPSTSVENASQNSSDQSADEEDTLEVNLLENIQRYVERNGIYHLIYRGPVIDWTVEQQLFESVFSLSWLQQKVSSHYSLDFFTLVLQDIEEFANSISVSKEKEISKERERLKIKHELIRLVSCLRLSLPTLQRTPLQLASQLLGRLDFKSHRPSKYFMRLRKQLLEQKPGNKILALNQVQRTSMWRPLSNSLANGGSELQAVFSFTKSGLLRYRGYFSFAFHPTQNICAIGCYGGSILVINLDKAELLYDPLDMHMETVCSLDFSQDGLYICSSGYDNIVAVFSVLTGDAVCKIEHHKSIVWRARFLNGDFKAILCCSQDKTVTISTLTESEYSPSGFEVDAASQQFDAHTMVLVEAPQGIGDVVLTSIGELVFSCDDKIIYKYARVPGPESTGEYTLISQLSGHHENIRCLALSDKEELLLSCGDEDQLYLWDIQLNMQIRVITNPGQEQTYSVLFGPEDRSFFAASKSLIRQFNTDSGSIVRVFGGHCPKILHLARKPNSVDFVFGSCSRDEVLRLWKPDQSYIQQTPEQIFPVINDVLVSSNRAHAIVGRERGNYSVYCLKENRLQLTYNRQLPSSLGIIKLAISNDNNLLALITSIQATTPINERVGLYITKVYDTTEAGSSEKELEIALPTGRCNVVSVAFSGNSKYLTYYSNDFVVRIYHIIDSGEKIEASPLSTFDFENFPVCAITWHPMIPLFVVACRSHKAVCYELITEKRLVSSTRAINLDLKTSFVETNNLHMSKGKAQAARFNANGHLLVIATESWIYVYSCSIPGRAADKHVLRLYKTILGPTDSIFCHLTFCQLDTLVILAEYSGEEGIKRPELITVNVNTATLIKGLTGKGKDVFLRAYELSLLPSSSQYPGLAHLPCLIDEYSKDYILPEDDKTVGFSVDSAPAHVQASFPVVDGDGVKLVTVIEANNVHFFQRIV